MRLTDRKSLTEIPSKASLSQSAERLRRGDLDSGDFCHLGMADRLNSAETVPVAEMAFTHNRFGWEMHAGKGYLHFDVGETAEAYAVAGTGLGFGRRAMVQFRCRTAAEPWVGVHLSVRWPFRVDSRQQAVDMVAVVHSVALRLRKELGCGREARLPQTPPTEPIEE